jgi:hypothetical protein
VKLQLEPNLPCQNTASGRRPLCCISRLNVRTGYGIDYPRNYLVYVQHANNIPSDARPNPAKPSSVLPPPSSILYPPSSIFHPQSSVLPPTSPTLLGTPSSSSDVNPPSSDLTLQSRSPVAIASAAPHGRGRQRGFATSDKRPGARRWRRAAAQTATPEREQVDIRDCAWHSMTDEDQR